MLKPLEQWYCDECGGLIQEPEHGYVEWVLDYAQKRNHGFRIVHHGPRSPRHPDGDCYRYTNAPGRSDLSLTYFVGPEGLVELLSKLDVGPYHARNFAGSDIQQQDMRDFVELFRRCHLPYYEDARFCFAAAEQDGFLDGANEIWIYLPETLKEMVEKYRE